MLCWYEATCGSKTGYSPLSIFSKIMHGVFNYFFNSCPQRLSDKTYPCERIQSGKNFVLFPIYTGLQLFVPQTVR